MSVGGLTPCRQPGPYSWRERNNYYRVLVNVERIRVYWSSNETHCLNAIVNK